MNLTGGLDPTSYTTPLSSAAGRPRRCAAALAEGLPIDVQLVARPWRTTWQLATCGAGVERWLGGSVRPAKVSHSAATHNPCRAARRAVTCSKAWTCSRSTRCAGACRVVGQSYLGIISIPVAQVVGSLDRTADFDRDFRARRGGSRQRLASLRAAFPDGSMPPIEAYEVGGAYFVSDGHHRVALAREREADFIDAEVTRLETNYELPRASTWPSSSTPSSSASCSRRAGWPARALMR